MKVIIKENGKIVRDYDYTNSNNKGMMDDIKNMIEYIEINKLAWTIEITK